MRLDIDPTKQKKTVGVRVPPEVLRVLRTMARERGRLLGTYLTGVLIQHASKHATREAKRRSEAVA